MVPFPALARSRGGITTLSGSLAAGPVASIEKRATSRLIARIARQQIMLTFGESRGRGSAYISLLPSSERGL